jgi:glyoxylase-like metal-dependent hydrolase (beta-lactamase superfamily II)
VSAPQFQPLGEDEFEYGRVDAVGTGLRRVIAENPSKFTYRGTGTYIIGRGDVAVVDPGPNLDSHRDALARALAGDRVRAILVTHCHADHSPLAAWLAAESGAPTYAFGPHPRPDPDDADEQAELEAEIAEGVKVEETTDYDFVPDVAVADGEIAVSGPGWTVRGVHTPGHTSNHMCWELVEQRALFPGDHVMGWSTTVVSPPDGDMAAYIESLRKVAGRRDAVYLPTHGPVMRDPVPYVDALVEHRLEREEQVLAAVRDGLVEIPAIVALLYAGVAEELHKPAGRSVLSHLVKLVDEGRIAVVDGARPRLTSTFAAV